MYGIHKQQQTGVQRKDDNDYQSSMAEQMTKSMGEVYSTGCHGNIDYTICNVEIIQHIIRQVSKVAHKYAHV